MATSMMCYYGWGRNTGIFNLRAIPILKSAIAKLVVHIKKFIRYGISKISYILNETKSVSTVQVPWSTYWWSEALDSLILAPISI